METSLNMIAGTAALIMVLMVMAAKLLLTQRLASINRQISQLSQVKQNALNRLKQAQSQKAIAQKNKRGLELKKGKLEKKISHLKQELSKGRKEEDVRRKRVSVRKI